MKAFSRIIVVSLGIVLAFGLIPTVMGHSTPSIGPSNFAFATPLSDPAPEPAPVTPAAIPTPIAVLAGPAGLAIEPVAPTPLPVPEPRAPGSPNDDLWQEMRIARREQAARAVATVLPADPLELFIHLPPEAEKHQPLRVLLVLHGFGGQGAPFAQSLIADADHNGWVLIAPDMPYVCDYTDPLQLMQEDKRLVRDLWAMLDGLPGRLGLKLRQHVLLYGFSRGAQIAHRFALFYPDEVEAVVAMSAGSYTLPQAVHPSAPKGLAFPYGIGDLKSLTGQSFDSADFSKITFWIAVGGKDDRPGDVARAFDAYNGKTRVERARAFAAALQVQGIEAALTIFPNADHEVTAEMRQRALEFLRQDDLANHTN